MAEFYKRSTESLEVSASRKNIRRRIRVFTEFSNAITSDAQRLAFASTKQKANRTPIERFLIQLTRLARLETSDSPKFRGLHQCNTLKSLQ